MAQQDMAQVQATLHRLDDRAADRSERLIDIRVRLNSLYEYLYGEGIDSPQEAQSLPEGVIPALINRAEMDHGVLSDIENLLSAIERESGIQREEGLVKNPVPQKIPQDGQTGRGS